jgi:hypothetical protein
MDRLADHVPRLVGVQHAKVDDALPRLTSRFMTVWFI